MKAKNLRSGKFKSSFNKKIPRKWLIGTGLLLVIVFIFLLFKIGKLINKKGSFSLPEIFQVQTPEASLKFSKEKITVSVNQELEVAILADTAGEIVSAIDAQVVFDPNILEFVSADKGTIAELPHYPSLGTITSDGTSSIIAVSAVNFNPTDNSFTQGYQTSETPGTLATLKFQTKSSSSTSLNFKYQPSLTNDSNVVKIKTSEDILAQVNKVDINTSLLPLGWWKFDETSGQAIENSGSAQGLDPSFLGANANVDAMDPVRITNGKSGSALQFDGSKDYPENDRVIINDLQDLDNSGAFELTEGVSVSLWFYADNNNTPNNYWYDIARTPQAECDKYWSEVGTQEYTTKDTYGGRKYDWWCGKWSIANNNWERYGSSYDQCIYNKSTHAHYSHIGCAAQGIKPQLFQKAHSYRLKYVNGRVYGYINKMEVSTPASSGAWHHVALTYDKNYIRLYLDGHQAIQTDYTENIKFSPTLRAKHETHEPIIIGYGFSGIIDEVKVYNKGITAEQVVEDMNN